MPSPTSRIATVLASLLASTFLLAQTQTEVFDSPGDDSFTVPTGVTELTVRVWGAGGAGGDTRDRGRQFTGGAGGGAFASSVLQVTPGDVIDLRVGAGGENGSGGGNSWFGSTSLLRAAGGEGVPRGERAGGAGGQAADSVGDVTFSGGDGARGRGRSAGGGGSSAGTATDGNDATGDVGATAPTGGGDGGDGSTARIGDGEPGAIPGGGGGGATSQNAIASGGAGGNGRIVVEYTLPPGDLILEYRMEESAWSGTSGEVADTSAFSRDGTAVGGADTAVNDPAIPGNPGTCRYGEFDGDDDGIDEPDAGDYLNGLGGITVMAWVFNTGSLDENDRGILFTSDPSPGRDNRLGLRYDTAGFFGGGDDVIKASVFTDDCARDEECLQVETVSGVMVRDQWQHVAMTWEAGAPIRVYVEGTEVGISAVEGDGGKGRLAAVNALNIAQGAKGQRWQGRIDEFRIFNGALTESQIRGWRDQTAPCEVALPDHLRLLHPGTGLTCRAAEITVQACADPDCNDLFGGEVTVDFTSPPGNWSPDPVTFTGQATVALLVPDPGTVTLDAVSNPSANGPTRCFTGATETCSMTWFDSGFVVDLPDHVSATTVTASVSAVRSDDTDQSCAPAFANETRTVGFWSVYANPGNGTVPVVVDGADVATASPGTPVSLAFDGNGVADVPVRYDDVGEIELHARYEGSGIEQGLVLTGSDRAVVRPAAFDLRIPGNPGVSDPTGPVFTTAGAPFDVEVSALNAAGAMTPNFGRETPAQDVALDVDLAAPAGGSAPPVSGSFDPFGTDCDGTSAAGTACGGFAWPEVGIIELVPRVAGGSYLGSADVVGTRSDAVGRFIPATFALSAGVVTDRVELAGCSDPFTYFGETLGADWTLNARNAAGVTTANYEGAFARLAAGGLSIDADEPIIVDSAAVSWNGGFGTVMTTLRADRGAPRDVVETFRVGTAPVDADGVALDAFDIDLDDDGVDDHGLVDSTELRYGRLVVDNAVGSELAPLPLPVRTEYFDDATWRVNAEDACTALSLADDVSLTASSGDTGTGLDAVQVGGGSTRIQESDPVVVTDGEASLTFSAPGDTGWVDVETLLGSDWPFLRDDLDDDGAYDDSPSARAGFGLFDGNENRILLQEIPPR